jgi:hypothetical protein
MLIQVLEIIGLMRIDSNWQSSVNSLQTKRLSFRRNPTDRMTEESNSGLIDFPFNKLESK